MDKEMTFDDLMNCYHLGKDIGNRNVYEDLKKKINGRIVPVIGAGLSCWAGYPLWSRLLDDIANNLTDDPATQPIAKTIKAHVKKQQYEKAGSVVECLYKSVQFQRKMKEVFNEKRLDSAPRPSYQYKIAELFPGPIITTNYDVSLERLLNLTYSVTPEDKYQKENALETIHDFERILIKLHGSVNIPKSMILTEKSYNNAYGKNPKKPDMRRPLPSTLQEALHVGAPFFLGCGLGPDRTCAVLKACNGVKGFALLELPKETENKEDPFHPILTDENGILPALDRRRNQMNDLKLQVIWYPYGKHEAVGILLEKLSEDKIPPTSPTVTTPPEDKSQAKPIATTVQQGLVYEASPLYQPRKTLTDKIVQKINNPRASIILVHGVAGIGKTEICKAAYRQIKSSNPDFSMPYIDLTGCETIRSVLDKIADVYGIIIPDIPSQSSGSHHAISLPDIAPQEVFPYLCRQISEQFGSKKQIAFLDNYEEVWYALAPKERDVLSEQLAKLAKAGLRFLISSQIDINVNCKINIQTMDHDTIKKINNMSWNDFTQLDSVQLFCNALGKIPSVKEEKEALKTLIAEIDGHPLSLLLAAYSGKKTASLVDLLKNWHQAQGRIPGESKIHKSLPKSLSLTWNYLSKNRAAILRWALHSLSLFPMDSTILSELCAELPEPVSKNGWSKSGQQLRQFGLVDIIANKEEEMLLAIKYALSYLDKTAIDQALTAWVTWCNKLTLDGDNDLDPNYVSIHERAMKYFPQYLYLADYCLDNQRYDELRILLQNLDNYYYTDAQGSIDLLKRVLAVPNIKTSEKCSLAWLLCDLLLFMGRISSARIACKKAEKMCRYEKAHYILAYVLQTKGKLFEYEGQIEDALASYSDAERLFRQEEKSGRGQASTLVYKGALLQRMGRIGEARNAYRYAEKVYKIHKDRLGRAYVLLFKGALAQLSCHVKLAQNVFDEAEKLFQEENDQRGRADLLLAKGALLYDIGSISEAMSAYDESEQIFTKDNNQNSLANILQGRGDLLRVTGHYEEARKSYDKAENMFKETQDKLGLANVLLSKAEWLKDNGQYSKAMDALVRAFRIYQKEMDNIGQTNTLLYMGEIYTIKGDYNKAEDAFSQVERLCHEGQNKLAMTNLWKLRGDMYVQMCFMDKAYKEYSKAEAVYQNNRIIPGRAELMLSKGELYLMQKEYEIATDHLKKALHLFQKIREVSGQCTTLLKLELCVKNIGNAKLANDYHRQATALMQNMPTGVKKQIQKSIRD